MNSSGKHERVKKVISLNIADPDQAFTNIRQDISRARGRILWVGWANQMAAVVNCLLDKPRLLAKDEASKPRAYRDQRAGWDLLDAIRFRVISDLSLKFSPPPALSGNVVHLKASPRSG